MTEIALYISLVHILYYGYGLFLSSIIKAGRMTTNKDINIERLRAYGVPIRTFDYSGKLWGFATLNTIHLNERLLTTRARGKTDPYYALKWTFFHELYHVKNKHKLQSVLMRLWLSLSPLTLIIFPWWVTLIIYLGIVVIISRVLNRFEKEANDYANEKLNERNNEEKSKGVS